MIIIGGDAQIQTVERQWDWEVEVFLKVKTLSSNVAGTHVLVVQGVSSHKVTEATAIQAYQYFRDICSWRLLTLDSPLMVGGPGVVIQIDESQFGHKPKVW